MNVGHEEDRVKVTYCLLSAASSPSCVNASSSASLVRWFLCFVSYTRSTPGSVQTCALQLIVWDCIIALEPWTRVSKRLPKGSLDTTRSVMAYDDQKDVLEDAVHGGRPWWGKCAPNRLSHVQPIFNLQVDDVRTRSSNGYSSQR